MATEPIPFPRLPNATPVETFYVQLDDGQLVIRGPEQLAALKSGSVPQLIVSPES